MSKTIVSPLVTLECVFVFQTLRFDDSSALFPALFCDLVPRLVSQICTKISRARGTMKCLLYLLGRQTCYDSLLSADAR